MQFSSLLCTIFQKFDGEKTVYAALHLLRGKRSGQTIQDVKYYNLKMFFSILPKLPKSLFDEAIKELCEENYILIDQSSIVHITEYGSQLAQSAKEYQFNGWDYRGREAIFFARLSLIVQTVSYFRAGEKNFMPAQKELEVQQFVKKFLVNHPFHELGFSQQLKEELQTALTQSGMDDIQKSILVHRLVGYEYTGWTWRQLANQLNKSTFSVKLIFIESLHMLLKEIEQSPENTLLNQIADHIKVQSHLTDSSKKTKQLFERGLTLEEIAMTRGLKVSTIEDHFVEMVINDEDFPIERFVSMADKKNVEMKSEQLRTKRLRILKEAFPHLTYFQLRLILGAKTRGGQ